MALATVSLLGAASAGAAAMPLVLIECNTCVDNSDFENAAMLEAENRDASLLVVAVNMTNQLAARVRVYRVLDRETGAYYNFVPKIIDANSADKIKYFTSITPAKEFAPVTITQGTYHAFGYGSPALTNQYINQFMSNMYYADRNSTRVVGSSTVIVTFTDGVTAVYMWSISVTGEYSWEILPWSIRDAQGNPLDIYGQPMAPASNNGSGGSGSISGSYTPGTGSGGISPWVLSASVGSIYTQSCVWSDGRVVCTVRRTGT